MSIVLAQITIPHDSNLPEDSVVNTWHFFVAGDPETANGADNTTPFPTWAKAALKDFYNPATGTGPGDRLSTAYQGSTSTIKMYDLGDAQPRVPFHVSTIDLGAGSGAAPLPEEVAVCLSYHSAFTSGAPRARRRGRVFLGPFTTTTLNLDVGNTIVDGGMITDTLAGATRLLAAGSDQAYWALYSPTDNAAFAVTGGWVDNAFDIQRRRGRAAANRITFGA